MAPAPPFDPKDIITVFTPLSTSVERVVTSTARHDLKEMLSLTKKRPPTEAALFPNKPLTG
jgi:hypothetical protein